MPILTTEISRATKSLLAMSIGFLLLGCGEKAASPQAASPHVENGVMYLGQGWEAADRQQLSYTSFGSRVINYDWFLALERAESETLFRSSDHMAVLGFINEPANEFNPDALPIGVTRDSDGQGHSWVGLTCAACHTGQVQFQGRPIRIDGGQSLLNYTEFETELLSALRATVEQPEKWQRFFTRLQSTQKNISADAVQQQIKQRIKELEIRYAINNTAVPYGHGRLDAFGQIFNAVAVEALNLPENRRSPNAPTSFPVLWDASHLDIVQWNASAPNKEPGPLAQNATTALAVYGTVDVLGQGMTYPSSIQIQNLGYIQKTFYKLTSPQWPSQLAGALDAKLIAQGEKIYAKECVQCHSLVDSKNLTRKLTAVVVPVSEVKTDPKMAVNFTSGKVKTGELEGKHFAMMFGAKFGAEASRLDVVMHVTAGALMRHPYDSIKAIIKEYASNNAYTSDDTAVYYKARPLNGIWSSAPYLHNGSVPTVYDLLLPAAQRPTQFFVGNRELDIVKVGNKSSQVVGSSVFDTTETGNSNVGHEYGVNLNDAERMALLEYLKSL